MGSEDFVNSFSLFGPPPPAESEKRTVGVMVGSPPGETRLQRTFSLESGSIDGLDGFSLDADSRTWASSLGVDGQQLHGQPRVPPQPQSLRAERWSKGKMKKDEVKSGDMYIEHHIWFAQRYNQVSARSRGV